MKNYAFIREAYSRTEKYYIRILDQALEIQDDTEYQNIQKLSRINEYAYFVLFWGQFETYINDKVFDIEGEDYERLGFMLRVGIVISPNHELYKDIDQYYDWRCDLAHGNHLHFPELTLSSIFDKIEEIIDAIDSNAVLINEDLGDVWLN